MPELPEVECLTRAVRASAEGSRIERAKFLRPDLRDPIPVDIFTNHIEGKVISRVYRRSKYMLWDVGDRTALFHLGMSGVMLMFDQPEPQKLHTHAVFKLVNKNDREQYLHFIDPRRFGRIDCLRQEEMATHKFFSKLGPEPLECKNLGSHLFKKSRHKSQSIKTLLMDAQCLVGVGNIYASESLFRAGIRPTRAAGKVTAAQYEKLETHIVRVLQEAIQAGGTSFRDYRHADGQEGSFEMKLRVYGRSGEPCLVCKQTIKEKRLAGRSTFYCPQCQA